MTEISGSRHRNSHWCDVQAERGWLQLKRALQAQAKATAVVKATDKERELEMLWQHARIKWHMTFS